MSIRIEVDLSGLASVGRLMSGLGSFETEPLMTNIGGILEASTRERIEETKTSPDGAAWPPNRAGTSTLLESGRHLRDSVASIASSVQVETGSSWEYAHVHQDGAVITPSAAKRLHFVVGGRHVSAAKVTIPARPFVGMSADDERKVDRLVTDFLSERVGGMS